MVCTGERRWAMALADKVKELRKRLGWNQATLAQKSGITQATISRIESGKVTQPMMGQLHKLADALGVTIDYLVGDSIQVSFNDLSKDKQAQIVFRGWGKLSAKGRQQLADFAHFLEQQEEKRGG
jgi:transcriptional regulator with XRE-family HTH domain